MSKCGHRAVIALGLVLGVVALAAGCAGREERGPSAFVLPSSPAPQESEYLIQPGDTIDITFYYHPDSSQQNLLVRPDGKVYLPLFGEVQAGGLTAPQIAEEVTKRASVNLRDPKVAVNVKSMNLNRVWVGGEVVKPGYINYTSGLTAVQALVQAGGWKDTADLAEVVLLQKVSERSNEYRPTKINLQKVVELGDVKADIPLSASDVLVLPKTGIARANLWVQQYVINMIPIRISASPF